MEIRKNQLDLSKLTKEELEALRADINQTLSFLLSNEPIKPPQEDWYPGEDQGRGSSRFDMPRINKRPVRIVHYIYGLDDRGKKWEESY